MLKVKSLLLPGISLFLLSMLPIAQVGRAESAPSSKPIGEPLCYQTTTNGTVLDLSKLCAENNQHKLTPEAKLANLSKAAIEAENQALISGNSKQGANLLSHGIRYTDFQTELKINKTEIQGNKASVDATEHTTMNLDNSGDPSAPKTTEYYQDRRLTFNLENDQWKLTSNKIINAPAPQRPEPGVPVIDKSTIPTSTNSPQSKNSNDQENNLIAQAGEKLNKLLSSKSPYSSIKIPNNSKNINIESELIVLASFNRQSIVDYAYKYWNNHNRQYRTFSSDCTNFASQALRAGGWTDISGYYTSTSAWWYTSLNQSRTWVNAHSWFWFTKDRPRASLARYASELELGDILQADWDKDGTIDHTMIVTRKDNRSNIYLTYRSSDTKDKSFWQLPQNANYWGWKLSSKYN